VRLWLDDIRPMPEGYTHHARTASEAIALLAAGEVTHASLDHDLGEGDGTGYEVAKWIAVNAIGGTLGPIELKCHSWNPVGREGIEWAIQKAKEAWKEARRANDEPPEGAETRPRSRS
jgi:hypothetical protein